VYAGRDFNSEVKREAWDFSKSVIRGGRKEGGREANYRG